MHDARELFDVGDFQIRLVRERHLRVARHDKMRLDPGALQPLQQTNAVDRARRAAHADDESSFGLPFGIVLHPPRSFEMRI